MSYPRAAACVTIVHVENSFMPITELYMRMRPIHSAAVAFVATLAVTVGSPGPAEAFLPPPIPIPMLQQSQAPVNRDSGRSPAITILERQRQGKYESAQPVKPSTGTRAKRDEEKSSSTSSGKSGKSQAKSESSSSQASRTRSVRQEPPASKSSGRASASARRESPAGGSGTPPATQPAQPSETSANSGAQAPSPTRAGSTLGDTYDEKLGEVFKARIDDLLKQSN